MSGVVAWALSGVALLALAGLLHRRRSGRWPLGGVLQRQRAPGRLGRRQFLEAVGLPLGVAGLVCLVGPLLGVWVFKAWREQRESDAHDQGPSFSVQPVDLVRPLTVADAEQAGRIQDPLQAVPALPFGHLHPAWLRFVAQRPAGAQLWTFDCEWTDPWGCVHARRGYVWVRGEARMPWWITRDMRKEVPYE